MRETIRLWPLVLLALFTWVLSGCDSSSPDASELPSLTPSASSALPTEGATDSPVQTHSAVEHANDIVAKVGIAAITREQLAERLLSQSGKQTLRELMLAAAVEQEAESLGLQATDEELEQELLAMMQGYDGEAQFYDSMREQLGMSRDDVRKEARYRLLTEKLSVRNVIVSDREVDDYVASHPELTSERNHYELAQIVVEDEETARQLLSQLEGGASFESLAERYSLDEFSAEEGGALGWIDEQDPFIDPEVLRSAAEMTVGSIAGPIATGDGFAILALNGRSSEQSRPIDEIRTAVRRELALGKAESPRALEQALLTKYGAEVLDESLR
ncbi:peptidylprolyl isomerase [Cohnella sp. GCM10027633]|uniref:peptidylprolyl isomerase n=1 Tax=unclassified Cohnella TaxID=2636738 RepID=UPI003640024B